MALRILLPSAFAAGLALSLAACGPDEVTHAGEVGWRLDYRNWTKPLCDGSNASNCSEHLYRDCSNAPDLNPGPPYDVVSKVRVLVEDPDGSVPQNDLEFSCADGFGGKLVPLRGLGRQVYQLTLQAKNAAGVVMYQHFEPELDLTSFTAPTFDMRSAVGEVNFFTKVGGNLDCPAGAVTLRYTFTKDGDTDPTVEGTTAACDGSFLAELFLRNIPTDPQPGANNNFTATLYNVKTELLDAANTVLACGTQSRPIKPGGDNASDDQNMVSGSCP